MSAAGIRFDGWLLDPMSGELERGAVRLRLQDHPLEVLKALLERPGELVLREELISRLWPSGVVDFDTGLNTAVRKLRTALGDTADTPRYIETLPRRGYRFIGPLDSRSATALTASAAPTMPAASVAPAEAESGASAIRVRGPRPTPVIVLGALFVLALGLWYGVGVLRRAQTAGGELAGELATGGLAPPHSLAVLPFANMSGDATQDYFADGVSEELLEALSRIDALQVAGRISSFHFKGSTASVKEIATALNVASVLEGSVRRSGQTVRIHAELVDAASGFRLWSETYDRNLGDVLSVQSGIANAVVGALRIRLADAASTVDLGGTRNGAALDQYLHGLQLADATSHTASQARALVATFDEAIRLDPNFALAYAARSRALNDYAGYFLLDATHEGFVRARADAERAISIAPALGEAHSALGDVLQCGFNDFAGAGRVLARALELAPADVRVLRSASQYDTYMGHFDQAIGLARRVVALDPINVAAHSALATSLMVSRDYPAALVEFDEAIRLGPETSEIHQRRGRTLYLLGRYKEAAVACEREPDKYQAQVCLPLIYEKLGRHEEAQAMLTTAIAEQGDYSSYQYMQIYAQWGDIPKALDWLEVAVRVQDPGLPYLKTDPMVDPLRGQPRFVTVERSMRYPD